MKRHSTSPRPDWPRRVESVGLVFHSTPEAYWDESAYYEFDADQIDTLEQAASDVHALCLQAVEHVVRNDLFDRLGIPPIAARLAARSWQREELTLYGRFDFGYDGTGPPKLLEYNADTPTALLEAAVVQWHWLEDTHAHADQFNSIHECLIEAWKVLAPTVDGCRVYFTASTESAEDEFTTQYLRDTAMQAGLETAFLPIAQIGWDRARNMFVDLQNRHIRHLFKLYPWEWLLREEFGRFIPAATTTWYEPPWKMLLSNKAILPVLWELFPEHPNLLRAAFEPWANSYVRKPFFSREGANVQIILDGREALHTAGMYQGPYVYQEFYPLPKQGDNYPVLGCWMVGATASGMGIRESKDMITRNTSRFVPHLFEPREAVPANPGRT